MARPRALSLAATIVAIGLAVPGAAVTGTGAHAQAPNLGADLGTPGRLRLGIWPDGGWVVQQYRELVEIRLPGEARAVVPTAGLVPQLGGYLSDLDVTSDGGDLFLRLTLDCDCVVALSGDGQSAMTIDIVGDVARPTLAQSSGPAPARAPMPVIKRAGPQETAGVDVDAAREHLMKQLLRAAEAGFVQLEQPAGEGQPVEFTQDTIAEADASGHADPVSADTTPEAAPAPTPEPAPVTAAPRQDYGDNRDAPSQPGHADNPGTSKIADASAASRALPDAGPVPSPTDSDAPKKAPDTDPAPSEPEALCFANEAFALTDLVHDVSLADRLGELRGQLVGEFDRPVEQAALELARLYVAAGFGDEARAVLADYAADAPEAGLYRELALLIDGHDIAETATLLREDCVGDHALWRAFAQAVRGKGAEAVRDEAMSGRALERLPVQHREALAAWIGDAAADAGDWDTARRMEAMAVRAARSLNTRHGRSLILSAKLAEWYDEPARAMDLLDRARGGTQRDADDALLQIARHTLRDERFIGADTTALQRDLGVLARDAEGTDTGREAFELEVRLHDRTATRRDAIALLAHGVEVGLYPPDRQYALLSDIVTTPSDDGRASPLAVLYLDDPDRFAPALALPGFRRELAQSMAALGVPDLAAEVLTEGDYADADLAETIARAYLQTDNPRQAIEIAGRMPDGGEKEALLGQALMKAGMMDRAQAHLLAASAVDDADPGVDTFDQQSRAALSAGDIPSALTARQKAFARAPDLAGAEELAMLALEAGQKALPAEAAAFLAEQDPTRLATLTAMFVPDLADEDLQSAEEVSDYLDRLDAEDAAIRGMLSDG